MRISTFSIVARDPLTGALGIAVASKFFGVGAVVPWVEAGVGAVAVQSFVQGSFGRRGLASLAQGDDAKAALAELIENDSHPGGRQLGIVDAQGRVANYTGPQCLDWAGDRAGPGFTCQGNYLSGPDVVEKMARQFETGSGTFARRLLDALAAGQTAGGDKRGQQGAAILIKHATRGYMGSDVVLDLRVDDHERPIAELERLMSLHNLYFGTTPESERIEISGGVMRDLNDHLVALGLLSPDADEPAFWTALYQCSLLTNLDERLDCTERWIDPPALDHLLGWRG